MRLFACLSGCWVVVFSLVCLLIVVVAVVVVVAVAVTVVVKNLRR